MSYEKKLLCQKYSEEIDTEKNPVPIRTITAGIERDV
jgi:hypothetical protein